MLSYSQFPFSVTPGQNINQSVGFNPLFAIVSNYSPFYLYFPDALSYVPPWTAGAVLQLAHATQARASWDQSPFGTQDVTSITGPYSATISFTNDPRLATVGGSPITDPSVQGSEVASIRQSTVALVAGVDNNFESFVSGVRKLLWITISVDVATALAIRYHYDNPPDDDGIFSGYMLASMPFNQVFEYGGYPLVGGASIASTNKLIANAAVNCNMRIVRALTQTY